jgi:hypothetical protein
MSDKALFPNTINPLSCLERAIAHAFFIGIGSAQVGEGRLGNREKVVGFTIVFSGDGDYRIANRRQAVPYQKYGEELLATLR